MSEVVQIPVLGSRRAWALILAPVGGAFLVESDSAEADRHAEALWQLREGGEYEYEFPDSHLYFAKHDCVSPSVGHRYRGRIRTGNLVGRLKLDVVLDYTCEIVGHVEFEVTSWKLDYREDYQRMLGDIARRATDLVFSAQELVQQQVSVDRAVDSSTRYQRFAFLRAILESDRFTDALAKICAAPIRRLVNETHEIRPASVRRATPSVVRQFARANKKPRWITTEDRVETCDVDENRFVKYVLGTFSDFLREISEKAGPNERLLREAKALGERLDRVLAEPFFRQVSQLTRMPLGSTALQRREGYREILRAWMIWDAAAKLAWKNGEHVYAAGKKNVAALYEYWCYFKLLEVVQKLFHVSEEDLAKELIVSNDQGLTLSLKEGKRSPLHGTFAVPGNEGRYRRLAIEFSYNATFNRKGGGSWTFPMRPDYTIGFRPEGMELEEAVKHDLVTYVHFDAKYKFDEIESELGEMESGETDGTEDETPQQRAARDVKRVDVLKMHAYRDAIRRTGGAYVLYPGNQAKSPRRLYKEILPGLGAFPLSPSIDSSSEIERFLSDVAVHLCDRLTQWEEYRFQQHAVYASQTAVSMLQADAIPGLFKAVKASGLFVLPCDRYWASPTSVRWITIPDDNSEVAPHVVRVAPYGYRGTMSLMSLKSEHVAFVPLYAGYSGDSLVNVWKIQGE